MCSDDTFKINMLGSSWTTCCGSKLHDWLNKMKMMFEQLAYWRYEMIRPSSCRMNALQCLRVEFSKELYDTFCFKLQINGSNKPWNSTKRLQLPSKHGIWLPENEWKSVKSVGTSHTHNLNGAFEQGNNITMDQSILGPKFWSHSFGLHLFNMSIVKSNLSTIHTRWIMMNIALNRSIDQSSSKLTSPLFFDPRPRHLQHPLPHCVSGPGVKSGSMKHEGSYSFSLIRVLLYKGAIYKYIIHEKNMCMYLCIEFTSAVL